MFIGHYASGLAFYMQKPAGKITFFILVLGTQFVDLLWGLFTLLGFEGGISGGSVEHNYFDIPWSHSLLMMVVWSVLYGFGTNYFVKQKYPELTNFKLLSSLSVFSHWVLDFIVHNDDMRILPTTKQTIPSLYLWEFPMVTFVLELAIIAVAWYLYWKQLESKEGLTAAKNPLIMLILMVVLHILGYLPTFSDTEGSEVEPSLGIVVMIMIFVIAVLMTWVHPTKPTNSQS